VKKPILINPNGGAATTLSPAQQECIQLLESVLENARNGEVSALAIVAVGPLDFGIAIAGSDAPKLYLGCGTAMRTLEARTSGADRRTVLHR
jgi:hypothetical protein